MSTLFDDALRFTLTQEGPGFVDDPRDPGGATYRGITLALYRSWARSPYANATALRSISTDELQAIYGACFWNPVRGDQLPAGLGLTVFDIAVNEGLREAALSLQRAARVVADGSIGPDTLAAVRRIGASTLLHAIATEQEHYYRSLKLFPVYGRGWLNRVAARLETSLTMVAGMPSGPAHDVATVARATDSPPRASSPETSADTLNAAELTGLAADQIV